MNDSASRRSMFELPDHVKNWASSICPGLGHDELERDIRII